jgi:hypothetical protein
MSESDVSCMTDREILLRVRDIFRDNPDIRSRILYGSDYFMDLFSNDSFDKYLYNMKKVLGKQIFEKISTTNPMKFKKSWYKKREG